MLEIELLSLFPSYLDSPLQESILKRALQKRLLSVTSFDIRSYSKDPHKKVDDRPFGGGPGMIMKPDVVSFAISDKKRPNSKVIYLSPQGRPFTSHIAKELAQEQHLLLVAGHYEGIDQRVLDEEVDMELSVGDFVLTNGCLAALVLIDSVARFIPGVLGHEESAEQDSFEEGLLDCPHYTKPLSFHGVDAPPVLRSGDHAQIALWRKSQQIQKTYLVRPDLFSQTEHLLAHAGMTLFSNDIVALKKWYKRLTKVEEIPSLLGFSCFFGSFCLTFVPGDMISTGLLSLPITEEFFSRFQKQGLKEPQILHLDNNGRLIGQDPDGRLLVFKVEK